MFSIPGGSFKSFENYTVKLWAKETKWTSLEVRTHPSFLETLISKYYFGPVKLPGLSRNGPLLCVVVYSTHEVQIWSFPSFSSIEKECRMQALSDDAISHRLKRRSYWMTVWCSHNCALNVLILFPDRRFLSSSQGLLYLCTIFQAKGCKKRRSYNFVVTVWTLFPDWRFFPLLAKACCICNCFLCLFLNLL